MLGPVNQFPAGQEAVLLSPFSVLMTGALKEDISKMLLSLYRCP